MDERDTRGVILTFWVSAAVVVAGVALALTLHSLLGPLLIIGGTLGLGWVAFVVGLGRIVRFLATGTWRSHR